MRSSFICYAALVSDAVDENDLLLNPMWGYQRSNPGQLPDPRRLCNNEPDKCTYQRTYRDYGQYLVFITCGPHVNWFPVTYDGQIRWHDHSAPGTDDDYNFLLQRQDQAGYTIVDRNGLLLEFDSDETVDHFYTPWWRRFHDAVDAGDGIGADASLLYSRGLLSRDEFEWRWKERYALAKSMVDGKYAIVTGLAGLDCEHSCGAELHPVYAMAIRVRDDSGDESWAIFVRNWGNQGFCGTSQHLWLSTSYTFRLPWKQGAASVAVLNAPGDRQFLSDTSEATGPNVTWSPGEAVLVNFTMTPPREDGTRINGELHLRWTFVGSPPPPVPPTGPVTHPGPTGAVPVEPQYEEEEEEAESIEKVLGDLYKQMSPEQRERFLSKLPKKSVVYDDLAVDPLRESRKVDHLALLTLTTFDRSAVMKTAAAGRKDAKARSYREAWCATFDNNIPGVPNMCKGTP